MKRQKMKWLNQEHFLCGGLDVQVYGLKLKEIQTYVQIFGAEAEKEQNAHSESNAQVRSKEKAAKRRASFEEKRQAILKSLATIANDIRAEYDSAYDQMEATSELLASVLACYGHGLLMKPVYSNNLPAITYEDCAKQIIVNHEDTWNAIGSILKGVKG